MDYRSLCTHAYTVYLWTVYSTPGRSSVMVPVTGVASLQSTPSGHDAYSTLHMYSPASEYCRPDMSRLVD